MFSRYLFSVHVSIFALLVFLSPNSQSEEFLNWKKLPSIPDDHGFAGPYGGVISGNLIVAGGANFPDAPPWESGKKQWHDRIFVLPEGAASWEVSTTTLPQLLAYGVSLSVPGRNSIVLVGGSDSANQPVNHCYEVTYQNSAVELKPLPDLPTPLAEMSGAAIGNTIYIFSGRTGTGTVKSAFRLNLNAANRKWTSLPWPDQARGRMHSAAGVHKGSIYLIGGRDFAGDKGHPFPEDHLASEKLDFLRDVYRFDPNTLIWKRVADLPRGLSAAPWSTFQSGESNFLLLGGVDVDFVNAQLVARPEVNGQGFDHPGFPPTIWSYHTISNQWKLAAEYPFDLDVPVTTPLIQLDDRSFILASGEIKPGIRTTQVIKGTVTAKRLEVGWTNWVLVAIYVAIILFITYLAVKNETDASTETYFLGNRKVPWWVAGLSIFSTYFTGILFLSLPGHAYANDITRWVGVLSAFLILPLVIKFYIPRFRELNLTSAYELLEVRFNSTTRVVASGFFILFHFLVVTLMLFLPALVISSVTEINLYLAIFATGVLSIFYTVKGGVTSASWVGAFQAMVILGGALICLVAVTHHIPDGIVDTLKISAQDSKLLTKSWLSLDISSGTTSVFVIFIASLFSLLPIFTASQDTVQRYLITSSEKQAARAVRLNLPLITGGTLLFFLLGTALYVFYKSNPELINPGLDKNENILAFYTFQNLPGFVSGIMLIALLAATQSSISSSLNSAATAYVTDFYGRFFRPDTSDQFRLVIAKRFTSIFGGAAMVTAVAISFSDIKTLFDSIYTIFEMTLGPVAGMFFLAIFSKSSRGFSALSGAVLGFVSVWLLNVMRELGVVEIWPLLNGMVSFLTTIAVGFALGATSSPRDTRW
ncbi:MAG: sodium/solute symporter [Verrucomicrobiales bacterium]|nr:sodium/solute symporter [Verrucomicrobiales bacterium]